MALVAYNGGDARMSGHSTHFVKYLTKCVEWGSYDGCLVQLYSYAKKFKILKSCLILWTAILGNLRVLGPFSWWLEQVWA